jgi:hypothetical protein
MGLVELGGELLAGTPAQGLLDESASLAALGAPKPRVWTVWPLASIVISMVFMRHPRP